MPGLSQPQNIRVLQTKVYSTFQDMAGQVSTDLMRLVETVPSVALYNTYAWLGAFPKFREWIGARQVQGLSQRAFLIYNKDFELTLGIDRNTLDDALLIEQNMVLRGMAREAGRLPRDLIIDLLRNGQSRVCYDGQFFFDTDHPVNLDSVSGTQSNYASSGFALTRANWITARARLRKYQGENGRPFGTDGVKFVTVVPPELEDVAQTLFVSHVATAGGMVENSIANASEVIVAAEMSTDAGGNDTSGEWYLFAVGDIPPFILQERQTPRIVMQGNPQDPSLFWHKEYIWGADARYGAGYGAWQRAFKGKA